MRDSDFNKLKQIYAESGEEVPEPRKTVNLILTNPMPFSQTKMLLYELSIAPVRETVKNSDVSISSILKGHAAIYKAHLQNYTNVLAQHKKIAVLCARELKRSLSKTSRTNPLLKTKRISKELNQFLKKSNRSKSEKIKSEEKKAIIEKRKKEEIEEENRQKRKFNYLLNQTESFASYFLNRKGSNDDLEGIKAAKKQLDHTKEFDSSKRIKSNANQVNSTEDDSQMSVYKHVDVPQPGILRANLRDYQLKGLNWLISLYNQGINGILADDMGLGKTIQSIAFLGYLFETKEITGPFLVVTPASTLHNWVAEFEKFIPEFKVLSYWGSVAERKELRKKIKESNIIITSYQIAIGDENILKKIKFQYMILDEAQAIKSNSSLRWKSLLSFKSRNRLLLTGTPIQNTMAELWALLHFIMPTLFDCLNEFSEWFSKEIESKSIDEEQINKLHTILKPFMLRRHKDDIKDEIGTKEIIIIECELSNRQRLLYDEIVSSRMDYENIVMHLKKVCNHPDLFEKPEPGCSLGFVVDGESGIVSYRSKEKKIISRDILVCEIESNDIDYILNDIKNNSDQKLIEKIFKIDRRENEADLLISSDLNLRKNFLRNFVFLNEKVMDYQISNNLDYYKKDSLIDIQKKKYSKEFTEKHTFIPPLNRFINDSGKLIAIDKLLKVLKEGGHRVLIYFQMTKMMDLFEEFLVEKEYSYLRLDGSSKVSQRKELVDEWQSNDGVFVFILSTRAGGVGINLTAADTVVFYDSDWNPTVDQQAMDRVHRLGQKKDVTVYKMITKNTIEERVMEMANKKDEMQKIVIKGGVFEQTN